MPDGVRNNVEAREDPAGQAPFSALSTAEAVLRLARRQLRQGAALDEAFRGLDAELRPRLLRYFRAASFSPEDAEDLVQKTLARVFQGIGGVREEEKLLAWLFTVARNVRNTAFERRPPRALPLEAVPELRDTKEGDATHERRERRIEAVWRAIESLPPRQRQCLPLQVRDGLSYEEIAATLRLSVNTVRNHLAAARESLRRTFEGCEP
jgi:RNA polymerase sigma-70 factor (ECF subfamily)